MVGTPYIGHIAMLRAVQGMFFRPFGQYSPLLPVRPCAAVQVMVFGPFGKGTT